MWLLFGNKARAKQVPGGRALNLRCDECNAVTPFVVCDIADKVSVFFVEVADMTSRRMVCTRCGDDQEVPSGAPPVSADTNRPPSVAAKTSRPTTTSADIDKQLAELKKRMGK